MKFILFFFSSLLFFSSAILAQPEPSHKLAKIAIANYGPHVSLQEDIQGLKEALATAGYKEAANITYDISDASFQPTLIRQMLARLNAGHPDVIVVLTTPVAQAAKQMLKNTPLVFSAITDPVAAKLIKDKTHGAKNISGATDQQDLDAFLLFVKKVLPDAKTVGMLYATGEDNDHALLKMMQEKTQAHGMKLMAVPIENPQEIPHRARLFKGKVDLIYVGTSGPIQPSLPAIISIANEFRIPIFNADATAVKENQVLGSFAVAYRKVGANTAKIILEVLKGKPLEDIPPIYPSLQDHQAFISKKKADALGIVLPTDLTDVTIID